MISVGIHQENKKRLIFFFSKDWLARISFILYLSNLLTVSSSSANVKGLVTKTFSFLLYVCS